MLCLRANRRCVGVILVDRSFVRRDIDPRVDDRWVEPYAGKVCLKDLHSKQRVGKNNVGLA